MQSRERITGSPYTLQQIREEVLYMVNLYREKHGAAPLQVDRTLEDQAQTWATHLANNVGTLEHHKPKTHGENHYCGAKNPGVVTGEDAVDAWYNEIRKYDFEKPEFKPETAQFTQLVWRKTTKIGVGYVRTQGNKCFIVAFFEPAGNTTAHFADNVGKPK